MNRWFRWYEGTTEDGKFRVVARLSRVTIRDVLALWAFILEDAAHLEHRGVCKRNEDFMASILDFDDGVVERILEAMESADMVSVGHGAITITNWGKRQFESDADPTASRRKREERARDKQGSHATVTRDTGGSETEADSTDTEKKDIRPKRVRTVYSEDFEIRFWEPYPRTPNMSKVEAWKAWQKLSDDDRLNAALAVPKYSEWLRSKPDHPAVHACRFLSQRRFDGFTASTDPPPNMAEIPGFYADFNSPELDAWGAFERTGGKKYPRDKRGGWRFPSQWPPNYKPPEQRAA